MLYIDIKKTSNLKAGLSLIPAEVTAITTNNPLLLVVSVCCTDPSMGHSMGHTLLCTWSCLLHSAPLGTPRILHEFQAAGCSSLRHSSVHSHSTCASLQGLISFLKEPWTRGKVLHSPDHQFIAVPDRKIRNRAKREAFTISVFIKKYVERSLWLIQNPLYWKTSEPSKWSTK